MHPPTPTENSERVVIIDDDEAFRIRASMFLRKAGYRAASAWNGEEALSLLLNGDLTPSLILLDLAMPIMDGWRFREIQTAHSKLWHIPVIAMADGPINEEYLTTLRPAGVLVKPFACGDLIKAVARALSRIASPARLAR